MSLDLRGVSHLGLSVANLDRSVAFYRDVLGLAVVQDEFVASRFAGREVLLRAGRVVIALQEHAACTHEDFDPRRPGLDHLAFAVESDDALAGCLDRLDTAGVAHSQIREIGYGRLVELRDPDGVQLELFVAAP